MEKYWLNNEVSLHWVNESSCLLQVECLDSSFISVDEEQYLFEANLRIQAWTGSLLRLSPNWLENYVPSYTSLLIVHSLALSDTYSVIAFLRDIAQSIHQQANSLVSDYLEPRGDSEHHRISVCYDPRLSSFLATNSLSKASSFKTSNSIVNTFPNDIESIAMQISEGKELTFNCEDVVALHTGKQYQVFTVGFLPNFAYMGLSDKALCIPRLSSPRKRVPAGAVAIADKQTAIYPQDSPGGWHILGYTPLALNSHGSVQFKAGDTVSFYAISAEQYVFESSGETSE